MNPDKFCRHCGTQHSTMTTPQTCDGCGTPTWHNPTPVVVVCQSVVHDNTGERGVVIGRRTIEPFKGGWNLIGGYIDHTDGDYRHAGAREFWEETGITISPSSLYHLDSYCDGKFILQFMRGSTYMLESDVIGGFKPNDECDELKVIYRNDLDTVELCFHSHDRIMRDFLLTNSEESGV